MHPTCSDREPGWDWVCRVAKAGGFRITGETGSALIARGGGAESYLWTTRLTRPVAEIQAEEGWSRIAGAGGAAVFGDEDLWRFWTAQGHIFWLQAGPRKQSELPSMRALTPLVESSRRLPPP